VAALHRAARSSGNVLLFLRLKIVGEFAPLFSAITGATARCFSAVIPLLRHNRENGMQAIGSAPEIPA
jgi:hypothetical protein